MSRRDVKQAALARMSKARRTPYAKARMAAQKAKFQARPAALGRAIMYQQPRGRFENKFYDPVTADGTKATSCASDAAVANSAGGYLLDTAAAPGAWVLNQIPQGTTQSNRLGRRAKMTGLRIKGFFRSTTASQAYHVLSLNVVHQLAPNNPSAMPTYGTIWVSQHSSALRAVNDADKLKVIREIRVGCHGDSDAVTTGLEAVLVDEFIDLKPFNIITEWTQADTTGTYGNMEKGALLLYALGVDTNANNFYGAYRVYFEDY